MANVIINDTHLNNIASAIREKNGTTTKYKPSEMPTAISAIETGSGGSSDEWQPQPDWWDIDKILAEDTEDYAGKIIVLISDTEPTTTINRINASKVATSDGGVYEDVSLTSYSHTWDRTKDKECSLGNKTRYIIWYYTNNSNIQTNGNLPKGALYIVVKNFSELAIAGGWNAQNGLWGNNDSIECIKFIDTTFNKFRLNSLPKELKTVKGIPSDTLLYDVGLSNLKYLDVSIFDYTKFQRHNGLSLFNGTLFKDGIFPYKNYDWTKINSFQQTFQNTNLKYLNKIDFINANAGWALFSGVSTLLSIGEVSNIKFSGFDFSPCVLLNHDTLIRVLNALYDYASEGSTDTYTLTLGTTNLAKLTDDEKAIATNKGWTLA